MREQILTQIETYKENLEKLNEGRDRLNTQIQENAIAIEQNRGALSAMYTMAVSQGIMDEEGNIIPLASADNVTEIPFTE